MGTLTDFDHLHEQIEKMWERLNGNAVHPHFQPGRIEPPADMYQTEDSVVVVLEMAGMRNRDIELSVVNGRLVVRGEKVAPHHRVTHQECSYSQVEIVHGSFQRILNLPCDVDPDLVAARYEDGLLTILLPKRSSAGPKKIRVTARES